MKLREEILESQRVAIIRKKKIFHQKHREIFQEELLRTQVREKEIKYGWYDQQIEQPSWRDNN